MRQHPASLLALFLAAAPAWGAELHHRCNRDVLEKLAAGSGDQSFAKYLTPGGLIDAKEGNTLCHRAVWGYLKKDKEQNLGWQKATTRQQQISLLLAADSVFYGVDLAADAYFKAADAVYGAGEKLKIAKVEKKTLKTSLEAPVLRLEPGLSLDGMSPKEQVEAILDVVQPDSLDPKIARPGRKIQEFYGKAVEVIRAASKAAPDLVKDPGETGWSKVAVKPPHQIAGSMRKVAHCEGEGEACWTDSKPHETALDRLDPALRNRVAATNYQVNGLFNHSLDILKATNNASVGELIGKLERATPAEKPKGPEIPESTAIGVEAYKKLFKEQTADKVFDGIEARTKLAADDPEFLTHDKANSLKKEYGAKLEGDKVVGRDDRKLGYAVLGADAALPAKLTEAEAKTQAQKAADFILKGDDLAGKAAALYGAVFVPQAPETARGAPNITGPGVGSPARSFAEEAKSASCGSPMDIGKSKSQLAREKLNERIAKKAKDNSKARKKDESAYDDEVEAAAEEEAAAKDRIEERFRRGRENVGENQTLDADERAEALGKLAAERAGALKAAADKKAARVAAAGKSRESALAQRQALAGDLSKEQKEQDALIVADYDRRIPDEVAKAKSFYVAKKKDSEDFQLTAAGRQKLAAAVNYEWQRDKPLRLPLRPQDIAAAHLAGPAGGKKLPKGGYFTERWEGEGGKASLTRIRGKLGIKADGTLDKRLQNVERVGDYIDEDLVQWYISRIMKPAEAGRKAGK